MVSTNLFPKNNEQLYDAIFFGISQLTICRPPSPIPEKEPTIRFCEHMFQTILGRKNFIKNIFSLKKCYKFCIRFRRLRIFVFQKKLKKNSWQGLGPPLIKKYVFIFSIFFFSKFFQHPSKKNSKCRESPFKNCHLNYYWQTYANVLFHISAKSHHK